MTASVGQPGQAGQQRPYYRQAGHRVIVGQDHERGYRSVGGGRVALIVASGQGILEAADSGQGGLGRLPVCRQPADASPPTGDGPFRLDPVVRVVHAAEREPTTLRKILRERSSALAGIPRRLRGTPPGVAYRVSDLRPGQALAQQFNLGRQDFEVFDDVASRPTLSLYFVEEERDLVGW